MASAPVDHTLTRPSSRNALKVDGLVHDAQSARVVQKTGIARNLEIDAHPERNRRAEAIGFGELLCGRRRTYADAEDEKEQEGQQEGWSQVLLQWTPFASHYIADPIGELELRAQDVTH